MHGPLMYSYFLTDGALSCRRQSCGREEMFGCGCDEANVAVHTLQVELNHNRDLQEFEQRAV